MCTNTSPPQHSNRICFALYLVLRLCHCFLGPTLESPAPLHPPPACSRKWLNSLHVMYDNNLDHQIYQPDFVSLPTEETVHLMLVSASVTVVTLIDCCFWQEPVNKSDDIIISFQILRGLCFYNVWLAAGNQAFNKYTQVNYHLSKLSGHCVTKCHSCRLVVRCDIKTVDN